MRNVIKALAASLALLACFLGLSYIAEALGKLTGGVSQWITLAAVWAFTFWASYLAFREIDAEDDDEGPEEYFLEQVVGDVIRERRRQIEAEGYDAEHDKTNDRGELASAACCYAMNARSASQFAPSGWPWLPEEWNPTTPRRDLVKAAALLLAEIERLDRVRV